MKIAMINGSPKFQDSTSGLLIQDLKSCFSDNVTVKDFCFNKPQVADETIKELNSFDALVFAYPLYVDGIPSNLLSCLYQIEKAGLENKNLFVYGIVNSGFHEGHQNTIALEILKNWCNKSGLNWGMGIGVGGGGAFSQVGNIPLGKGPKTSLGKAFNRLEKNILNKSSSENIYISVNFPRLFYKLVAEMGWKQLIRKNGKKPKDLNYKY